MTDVPEIVDPEAQLRQDWIAAGLNPEASTLEMLRVLRQAYEQKVAYQQYMTELLRCPDCAAVVHIDERKPCMEVHHGTTHPEPGHAPRYEVEHDASCPVLAALTCTGRTWQVVSVALPTETPELFHARLEAAFLSVQAQGHRVEITVTPYGDLNLGGTT